MHKREIKNKAKPFSRSIFCDFFRGFRDRADQYQSETYQTAEPMKTAKQTCTGNREKHSNWLTENG